MTCIKISPLPSRRQVAPLCLSDDRKRITKEGFVPPFVNGRRGGILQNNAIIKGCGIFRHPLEIR